MKSPFLTVCKKMIGRIFFLRTDLWYAICLLGFENLTFAEVVENYSTFMIRWVNKISVWVEMWGHDVITRAKKLFCLKCTSELKLQELTFRFFSSFSFFNSGSLSSSPDSSSSISHFSSSSQSSLLSSSSSFSSLSSSFWLSSPSLSEKIINY